MIVSLREGRRHKIPRSLFLILSPEASFTVSPSTLSYFTITSNNLKIKTQLIFLILSFNRNLIILFSSDSQYHLIFKKNRWRLIFPKKKIDITRIKKRTDGVIFFSGNERETLKLIKFC